jgi:hypothetical protein
MGGSRTGLAVVDRKILSWVSNPGRPAHSLVSKDVLTKETDAAVPNYQLSPALSYWLLLRGGIVQSTTCTATIL